MKSVLAILLAVAFLAAAPGCGQKGPLYHPGAEEREQAGDAD